MRQSCESEGVPGVGRKLSVAVNGQARDFGARNQVWGDNVAEIPGLKTNTETPIEVQLSMF